MKRVYNTPVVEVERYQLETSIAANCDPSKIVTLGPSDESHSACEEFDDGGLGISTYSLEVSFYDKGNTCTCYYSAGGEGYFTS